MKSTFVAISILAAVGATQDVSSLPKCGQLCATNMFAKADKLGCDAGSVKCLCANKDFMYGLRDCSQAVCSSDEMAKVMAYGMKICSDAGVKITDGGDSDATMTGTGTDSVSVATIVSTSTDVLTSTDILTTPIATTTLGNGDDSDDSDGGAGGAGKVVTYTSAITGTDGSVVTTVGTTTVGGAGGAGGSGQTTMPTATVTETTSAADATNTDESDNSDDSDNTDGAGASGSPSDTDGAALPQRTAAPAAVLAAAGLAALFL